MHLRGSFGARAKRGPLFVVLSLISAPAFAQPTAIASHCETPPTIDGFLEDPCWQDTEAQTDFTQRTPEEGAPPTQFTRFGIGWDEHALYVAVRADDTGEVLQHLARRDENPPSDWITVYVGALGDRRTARAFSVNPAGVRRDWRIEDDTATDVTWDAVWTVETHVDDGGWTAEFRIPLSQLRFTEGNDAWDFQVERSIARRNESILWAFVPRDASGWVSRFGRLTRVSEVPAPKNLELLPYAMGGLDLQTGNELRPLSSVGGDAAYGLTGDTTLALTLNPDFGQVEADPAQVNLSAFETRFEERRPFFAETKGLFSTMGPEFFYSRRIGRPPQGAITPGDYESVRAPDQTTVLGAARLSGRAGDTSFALLDAVTSPERARLVTAEGVQQTELVEPLTNYLALRTRRSFRDGRSNIGILTTAVDRFEPTPDELRDHAYGGLLDFEHRFASDSLRVAGYAGFSAVHGPPEAIEITQRSSARYFQRPGAPHLRVDPTLESLTGGTGGIELSKISGRFVPTLGVSTSSPGFEINDAGFLARTDRTDVTLAPAYRSLDPGPVFRSWTVSGELSSGWTYGGESLGQSVSASPSVQWLNYWTSYVSASLSTPEICVDCTRGGPSVRRPWSGSIAAGSSTDPRRTVAVELGGYYFAQPDSDTYGVGVDPALVVRPTSSLLFSLAPSFQFFDDGWMWVDDADERYVFARLITTTTSLTFRADVTFSADTSLQVFAQPFLASGAFDDFMKLDRRLARDFDDVFRDVDVVRRDTTVELDEDGNGDTDFVVPDQDFVVGEYRNTVVFRWEFLPGSTFFAVWQHQRSHYRLDDYPRASDVGALFGPDSEWEHIVLVKLTHWVSF